MTTKRREPATKVVKQRFTAQRKIEAVRRLLGGEDLDVLARQLGVTAAAIAGWKTTIFQAGEAALKSRSRSAEDDEQLRMKAVVGDLAMRNELLRAENRALKERGRPFAPRRSTP